MSLGLERTKSIQGLRLLFVLGVVFTHANKSFVGEGVELCSFFFIVSGFLFTNRFTGINYVKHKLKQMYPVYFFFLIIMTIGLVVKNHSLDVIETDFLLHLFLLQSYVVGDAALAVKYLGPAWFLSSLLLCYALAPTISKYLRPLHRKGSFFLLLLLYAIGVFYLTWLSGKDNETWWGYVNPLFRFGEYLLGILLSKCLEGIDERNVNFQIISLLILVVYVGLIASCAFGACSGILHIFMIAFVYLWRSTWLDAILGNRVILRLSRHCLFIFLGHFPFLIALMKLGVSSIMAALFSTLICVLFGELYMYILNIKNRKNV